MDEKLKKLINNANYQIQCLEWAKRKQSHLKGITTMRQQNTEESINKLIEYIKENY